MIKTISIKNNFPATISTRKVIADFCQKMDFSSANKYILDFSGIVIISRSCTDELIRTFASKSVKWDLKNANYNIHTMFAAVQRTQTTVKHDYDYVAITPFLSKPELGQFLAAI